VSRSRRGLPRVAAPWVAWWLGAMVLWLLLTSTTNPSEAVVGAGAAAVTATVAVIVGSTAPVRVRPRARWFARAWTVPVQIATDTWAVTRALALHATGRRRVRGTYAAIPFRHGRLDDPGDSARRALATIGLSLSPNTYVIGIGRDDFLFVHQLVANPQSVEQQLGGP
jgi:multisubunit Na+/H+ antiporter MnhE subunit